MTRCFIKYRHKWNKFPYGEYGEYQWKEINLQNIKEEIHLLEKEKEWDCSYSGVNYVFEQPPDEWLKKEIKLMENKREILRRKLRDYKKIVENL